MQGDSLICWSEKLCSVCSRPSGGRKQRPVILSRFLEICRAVNTGPNLCDSHNSVSLLICMTLFSFLPWLPRLLLSSSFKERTTGACTSIESNLPCFKFWATFASVSEFMTPLALRPRDSQLSASKLKISASPPTPSARNSSSVTVGSSPSEVFNLNGSGGLLTGDSINSLWPPVASIRILQNISKNTDILSRVIRMSMNDR